MLATLNDYYEFSISAHFVSAIINDNYSGLSEEECELLTDFLNMAEISNHSGTWYLEPDFDENFQICEITELFSNCVTAKYYFFNENL